MPRYFIYGLGFLAQALFASRMIVQWIQSEKAGRVISPTLFWQTSLVASLLLLVYGILRHDIVIVFGQSLSYFIYIRNLQLKGSWTRLPIALRLSFFMLPFLLYLVLIVKGDWTLLQVESNVDLRSLFLVIGFVGQLLMNLRFVYQWYYSERINRSIFPRGFWILSLAGSVMILGYAFYRMDPVLLLANSLGFVIYTRNIVLGKNSAGEQT